MPEIPFSGNGCCPDRFRFGLQSESGNTLARPDGTIWKHQSFDLAVLVDSHNGGMQIK
jgi:hypothetical protein